MVAGFEANVSLLDPCDAVVAWDFKAKTEVCLSLAMWWSLDLILAMWWSLGLILAMWWSLGLLEANARFAHSCDVVVA